MEIVTKRVYEPAVPGDGHRVLVDRVWPRGVSRARAGLELWLREAGPSHELRRWFGHQPVRWDEFRQCYQAELAQRPEVIEQLLALAADSRLTLIYSARDPAHNQAVVLRDYLLNQLGRCSAEDPPG